MEDTVRKRSLILAFLVGALMISGVSAQDVYTPAKGSKERSTIIDSLRVPVMKELKQPIIFQISALRVSGNWAFLDGEPLAKSGGKPDYSNTVYAEALASDMFDNNVFGLLRKEKGKWVVVEHMLGCTDVCYLDWSGKFGAPLGIFGLPDQAVAASEHPLTPTKDSYLRKTLVDTLRVPVKRELRQSVIFRIETIRVSGNWAFIAGEPLQPSGKMPSYAGTIYANDVRDGAFDNNVFGLLKRDGGSWRVVRHLIGCTDVCYLGWQQEYGAPKEIFPFSD